MKKFTESEALALVSKNKGVEIKERRIIKTSSFEGFSGLTTCSAYDFLVNHCGYKA